MSDQFITIHAADSSYGLCRPRRLWTIRVHKPELIARSSPTWLPFVPFTGTTVSLSTTRGTEKISPKLLFVDTDLGVTYRYSSGLRSLTPAEIAIIDNGLYLIGDNAWL